MHQRTCNPGHYRAPGSWTLSVLGVGAEPLAEVFSGCRFKLENICASGWVGIPAPWIPDAQVNPGSGQMLWPTLNMHSLGIVVLGVEPVPQVFSGCRFKLEG